MLSYLRFLYRNKLYTLVNVLGFAVSLMFVILIADYAWRQNSTDSWNKNKDRIFLLGTHSSFYSWPEITSGLAESFPEIEKMCGVMSHHGKVKSDLHYYESDDEPFILLADSTFFDFFDFKFVIGDKATAMDSPDKCVITESMAQQLFNDEYPIGKSIQSIYLYRFLQPDKLSEQVPVTVPRLAVEEHDGLVLSIRTVWFAGHTVEFPTLSETVPGDSFVLLISAEYVLDTFPLHPE